MKTRFLPILAALFISSCCLRAEVLTATTAVHTQPDEAAPVVSYLKAGSTVTPRTDSMANSPAGWIAVDLPAPFEAFVLSKEINKSLDVRAGAKLHQKPSPESGVIATAEAGDSIQITGVRGKWTRLSVDKSLIGYARISALPPVASQPASEPAQPAPLPSHAPVAAPEAPLVHKAPPASVPHAAQSPDLEEIEAATFPRTIEGKLVSTWRPLAPRRPYDYQINDSAGVRFAYLDLSRITTIESAEKYQDKQVAVFGVMRRLAGTKHLVIVVESIQLR